MRNKILLLTILVFVFASCGKMLLSLVTPSDVEKSLKVLKKDDQTVVFLGTVHLAKPEFFDSAKKIIDSLKRENFTVFYESITFDDEYYKDKLDSTSIYKLDTTLRKFRKMMGRFQMNDLTDKNNKSLPNYFKNNKYLSQTNNLLGIDSLDINADVTMSNLISAQEKEDGEIILTNCDFNTSFKDKYKCEKVSNYYSINTFRDSIVFNKVLVTNKKKSLIVFGKGHWYGIWPHFRDLGYIEIK